MKKRTSNLITLFLIFILLAGLSLLLYPTVSDYWNSLHQSRAIASYAEQVATLDNDTYDQLLEQARAYNATLPGKTDRFRLSDEELAEYNATLNVPGTNVSGASQIDKSNGYLPISPGPAGAAWPGGRPDPPLAAPRAARPSHRGGAGLLHAGHLHALRHQHPPAAGARPPGRQRRDRVCLGRARDGGRHPDRHHGGSPVGGCAAAVVAAAGYAVQNAQTSPLA